MNISSRLDQVKSLDQTVAVVGLGVSGLAVVELLVDRRIKAVAFEKSSQAVFESNSASKIKLDKLVSAGLKVRFGVEGIIDPNDLINVGLLVISPGVKLQSGIINVFRNAKIPIVSELEFGIQLLSDDYIIVTGSNGKSTTVSLIDFILRQAKLNSILCGNIGQAVTGFAKSALIESISNPVLVVEASSYQLESCQNLKPKVGILLNLTANHLERHGSLENYLRAKARAFVNQDPSDFAILNADDQFSISVLRPELKARILTIGFSSAADAKIEFSPNKGIDRILVSWAGKIEEYLLREVGLLGMHNRYNIAAAILAARIMQVPQEIIQTALSGFRGLEHRIEYLGEYGGAAFINDAKSTTVASVVAAFESLRDTFGSRKIVLLVGGQAKEGSWEPVFEMLKKSKNNVRDVILFGGSMEELLRKFTAAEVEVSPVAKLKDAFLLSLKKARPDDIVLLSPGCASFDEFRNFEERGRYFKELFVGLNEDKAIRS